MAWKIWDCRQKLFAKGSRSAGAGWSASIYQACPAFLSGGKQRLAIAGTMVMKPRYLVLDEPTAMLDPQGREDVADNSRMNQEEKVTIIYITHFMEEALQADRICIMQDGAIVLLGVLRNI